MSEIFESRPIAYAAREGGHWIPTPLWEKEDFENPAAVMYIDGAIWDYVIKEWRKI